MFHIRITYRCILVFCFLWTGLEKTNAQSENQLSKSVNSFFSKKEYAKAIDGYRQLLSNDLKNVAYNYGYAVCLFHTKSPQSSEKYFNYLLEQKDCPIEVSYFKGKLYHLNYEFDKAINMYANYANLRTKKSPFFDVLAEIKRCQNAQELLKSPRAIQVISQESKTIENYFAAYLFDSLNFKQYTIDEYNRKINAKNNFSSKYVFRRGMKYRFFSSYSNDPNTGKDLYYQTKNSANDWEEPVLLPSSINTSYDEDFPFYDERTGLLYFSSKGHNSMGGYDLFRIKLSLENLVGEKVENLNFPYSSTANDFLFVPNPPSDNVFFTTDRNEEVGEVKVIEARFNTPVLSSLIASLYFKDEIDLSNTEALFFITNQDSKEKFGPYRTNNEGLLYFIVPAPGAYRIEASVSGSDKTFNDIIDIPPHVEGFEFEVEATYKTSDSREVLTYQQNLIQLSDMVVDIENIELKEFAKLEVNTKTIDAANDLLIAEEKRPLNNLEIQNKLDEFFELELELEDRIRQKIKLTENVNELHAKNKEVDEKIDYVLNKGNERSQSSVDSLNRILQDLLIDRKIVVSTLLTQKEYNASMKGLEDLKALYSKVVTLNKQAQDLQNNGKSASLNDLLKSDFINEQNKLNDFSPLPISRAEITRKESIQKGVQEQIELITVASRALKNKKSSFSKQMLAISDVEIWKNLNDSIAKIDRKLNTIEAQTITLNERNQILEGQLIYAKEGLLNITLIDAEGDDLENELIELNIVVDEDKYASTELFSRDQMEASDYLNNLSTSQKEERSRVTSSSLSKDIKDSLVIQNEYAHIVELNQFVEQENLVSENKVGSLIQDSEIIIESLSQNNEDLSPSSLTNNIVDVEENTVSNITGVANNMNSSQQLPEVAESETSKEKNTLTETTNSIEEVEESNDIANELAETRISSNESQNDSRTKVVKESEENQSNTAQQNSSESSLSPSNTISQESLNPNEEIPNSEITPTEITSLGEELVVSKPTVDAPSKEGGIDPIVEPVEAVNVLSTTEAVAEVSGLSRNEESKSNTIDSSSSGLVSKEVNSLTETTNTNEEGESLNMIAKEFAGNKTSSEDGQNESKTEVAKGSEENQSNTAQQNSSESSLSPSNSISQESTRSIEERANSESAPTESASSGEELVVSKPKLGTPLKEGDNDPNATQIESKGDLSSNGELPEASVFSKSEDSQGLDTLNNSQGNASFTEAFPNIDEEVPSNTIKSSSLVSESKEGKTRTETTGTNKEGVIENNNVANETAQIVKSKDESLNQRENEEITKEDVPNKNNHSTDRIKTEGNEIVSSSKPETSPQSYPSIKDSKTVNESNQISNVDKEENTDDHLNREGNHNQGIQLSNTVFNTRVENFKFNDSKQGKEFGESIKLLTTLIFDSELEVIEDNSRPVSKGNKDAARLLKIKSEKEEKLKYYQNELELEIANQNIENKYLRLKEVLPGVQFESIENLRAQLLEIEIKEQDLVERLRNAISQNEINMLNKLIEANQSRKSMIQEELDEMRYFDSHDLLVETRAVDDQEIPVLSESTRYLNYVEYRQRLQDANQILNDLSKLNRQKMMDFDLSLRASLKSETLTPYQKQQVKEIRKLQQAIVYLEEEVKLRTLDITQDNNAPRYEYLYQENVNPTISVVEIEELKSIKKLQELLSPDEDNFDSKDLNINKAANVVLSNTLKVIESKNYQSYVQDRVLANSLAVELNELLNPSNTIVNQNNGSNEINGTEVSIDARLRVMSSLENREGIQKEEVIVTSSFVNDKKVKFIKRKLAVVMDKLVSIDSSSVYESLFRNEFIDTQSNYSVKPAGFEKSLRSLDLVDYTNASIEQSDFTVLNNDVVVDNDETFTINESNPSGLNFRVQVGAFRRPVREDVYREFTPVSGQKLSNGLIVYMAGYFNNSSAALNAQKEIRKFGYSDAFIVAYCNDERLAFWKGREYERNGTCISNRQNDFMVQTTSNENTVTNSGSSVSIDLEAEKLNIPSENDAENNTLNTNKIEEAKVKGSLISKQTKTVAEVHAGRPVGSVDVSGLFYSVQVGAFNRKIRGTELSLIPELDFYESKGLFRYSSGKFNAIDEARLRRAEVVSKGVSDAFVVVYYNGKRITMQEARGLLQDNGTSVLYQRKGEIEINVPSQVIKNRNNKISTSNNPVISSSKNKKRPIKLIDQNEIPEEHLIVFSLKSDSLDKNSIERLNRVGVFHYNLDSSKIKSQVFKARDVNSILSFYVNGMQVHDFNPNYFEMYSFKIGSSIEGELGNWLLRNNRTIRFTETEGEYYINFYLESKEDKELLLLELNQMQKQ